MEKGPSLSQRLLGLCIFFAGLTFLIIYGSEFLLEKLSEKGFSLGHGYHYDRIYNFLDFYLRVKDFVLYEIGIKKIVGIGIIAVVIMIVLLRKLTRFHYYKILPIFFGHTFRAEANEFEYMPFNLAQHIKQKAHDEGRGPSEIAKIKSRYNGFRALWEYFMEPLKKSPLFSKFYERGLLFIDRQEKWALSRFSNRSLYQRTFLGLRAKKRSFALSEDQRCKHVEVIGKSGTGKTKSVLIPIAIQDMMVGKSVIIVNGKGDQNFPSLAYAAARSVGRKDDFLFFNLAFPKNSHTYNPVHLGRYGDPLVVADRMFSVLGYQNEYYRDIAFNFFKNLVYILAETGKPFSLQDIYICVCSKEARDYVCGLSSAKRQVKLLEWSSESLDRQREDTLSGLKTKLEFYCSNELLNTYDPDIIIEDVVEKDQIVFLSLNVNMMPTLAPAVARLFLRELQQHVGGREADLHRNQNPCSIILDEFSTFIYKHFHVAISQFREGKAQLTFAHQSGCDLNLFEKELGSVVWDNAQTKIVLAQDDSLQCQKIAEMIGTQKVIERTERFNRGFLFLRKPTFESSNKYVDEFLFHPNKIKKLKSCGQGYVLTTRDDDQRDRRIKKDATHPESNEKESTRITGINLGLFPEDFYLYPVVKRKPEIEGLNLTQLFLGEKTSGVPRESKNHHFMELQWLD